MNDNKYLIGDIRIEGIEYPPEFYELPRENDNSLFLGVPGSGKSFAAKRELLNVFLTTNDKILMVKHTPMSFSILRF